MSQPIEEYYEREFTVFDDIRDDFARQYPADAGRLLRDPNRPPDPHLERFIEGFALLAARVHHKLDDEFPELTEALLQILYPHFLTPVPSLSIAQIGLPPQIENLQPGAVIGKQTRLRTGPLGSHAGSLMPCRWRTGYPVALWPIALSSAKLLRSFFPPGLAIPRRTAGLLVLEFECLGPWSFADLDLDRLRLYLSGNRQSIADLYEVLFNHVSKVVFRPADAGRGRPMIELQPQECLFQVGFEPDEAILPQPAEALPGYGILTEFLSLREKFLFADLGGWRQIAQAGFGKKVEAIFFLGRADENLEQGVTARTFLLGCTPIINLFPNSAEPLAVTQKTTEYPVVPSRTHPMGMEVISVDSITAIDPVRGGKLTDYQPQFTFASDSSQEELAFWYAARRPSPIENDRGTEVHLVLIDSEFDPRLPAESVLNVHTTCSNRDWPDRFQRPNEKLFLESGLDSAIGPVECLQKPTAPLRPPLNRKTYWRLVAQNNLNHISLTDHERGRLALQEILRLCDYTEGRDPVNQKIIQKIIEGITGLSCRPVRTRVSAGPESGACRGMEIALELDEKNYIGVGVFLFACVLERFLALHAGLNSFSVLMAKTKQAEGYFKKWPPRAAHRLLR